MGKMKQTTFRWVLLLVFCGIFVSFLQAADENGSNGSKSEKKESGLQLKVNQQALMQAEDLQTRVDAASVMLYSESEKARDILLEVLTSPNNPPAAEAVCQAIKQSRSEDKSLKNKQKFIDALLEMLKSKDTEISHLAAETLLIFSYDEIQKPLLSLLKDESVSTQAKKNVIYALKLQPDMDATFELIKLLDSNNEEVISTAEEALNSLGIPVTSQPNQRKLLIKEMKQKGKDSLFRDLRIRQQGQVSELEEKVQFWKDKYLESLEQLYGNTPDKERGEFLADLLESSEPELRLWALDKVYQGRIGTAGQLPSELEPILVDIVSDPDKRVRLETAKVLALMSEINSAEQLLEQVKNESEPEVKSELFKALGSACRYAFSSNSEIELPEEVKQQTLDLAADFLMQKDPSRAQEGAKVIKRLIAQDNTPDDKAAGYLGMIAERFETAGERENENLKIELLNIMADLCLEQNEHSRQASDIYKQVFLNSLDIENNENESVRLTAMEGLININKANALRIFRGRMVDDPSEAIQGKLIKLAGEIGSEKDLQWLAGKVSENAQAWSAMLDIFQALDKQTNKQWYEKFVSDADSVAVSDQQFVNFLQIVEEKLSSEEDLQTLITVREKLVELYKNTNAPDKAAQTLGKLLSSADTEKKKNQYFVKLMKLYLQTGEFAKVKDLINNRLLEGEFQENGQIIKTLEKFVSEGKDAQVKNLLSELNQIQIKERPLWESKLSSWNQNLANEQKVAEEEAKQEKQEVEEPNQPA
jgi:hypothetical protein